MGGRIIDGDAIPPFLMVLHETGKYLHLDDFVRFCGLLRISHYETPHEETPPYPWGGFYALGFNGLLAVAVELAPSENYPP